MSLPFSVFVRGQAQPKGSKRGFNNPKTGRVLIVDDLNPKMRQWERAIQGVIQHDWNGPPETGPLGVALTFTFALPKSAPKRNPPVFKDTQPDADKLARLVNDALEGVVYRNDGQIANLHVVKRYGEEPGLQINITSLEEELAVEARVGL